MGIDKVVYQAEANAVRLERTISRLWILLIIMLIFLVGTNVAWICYEQQFEDISTTTTVTQDVDSGNGGDAAINDGVHINGESETERNGND